MTTLFTAGLSGVDHAVLDLAQLPEDDAARVASALRAARTESTLRVHHIAWRQWQRWCTDRELPALPADPAAVCAYLAERAATGTAVASLNVACSATSPCARSGGGPAAATAPHPVGSPVHRA